MLISEHGDGRLCRSVYNNDQVIGGSISSMDELKSLEVGTIIGQMNGKTVEHGGIIVMHDFGGGEEKAIYQSMGNDSGGPTYTRIKELGDWNIWLWHDGVVRGK